MNNLWEAIVRWRTWLVNVLFASPIILEVAMALVGYNWGTILPPEWMPYVLLAQAVLNVWMRPRPAVISSDPEVDMRRNRIRGEK